MRVQHNGRAIDLSWGDLFFSGNIALIYKGDTTADKAKRVFFTILTILVNLPFCIPKLLADSFIGLKHIKMNIDSRYPSKRGPDGTITQVKPRHPASEKYTWSQYIFDSIRSTL